MRKATEAMHRSVGKAITELRRAMNWSQAQLAEQIGRNGGYGRLNSKPTVTMISDWENGGHAPSSDYRAALARIARKHKATKELELIFLASTATWRVVSRIESLHGGELSDPRRDTEALP